MRKMALLFLISGYSALYAADAAPSLLQRLATRGTRVFNAVFQGMRSYVPWRTDEPVPKQENTSEEPVPAAPMAEDKEEPEEPDIPLPPELQVLEHIELRHMRSCIQNGPSCAWYSVFNAHAIQVLTRSQMPLTASAIKEHVVEKMIPLVEKKKERLLQRLNTSDLFCGIYVAQKVWLATAVSLEHYYVIEIMQGETLPFLYSKLPDNALESCLQRRPGAYREITQWVGFIKALKEKNSAVQHILLTVPLDLFGNHAVLLSVVWRSSEKPLVIYMDSNNASLMIDLYDYPVPKYVIPFIKQLDNAIGQLA